MGKVVLPYNIELLKNEVEDWSKNRFSPLQIDNCLKKNSEKRMFTQYMNIYRYAFYDKLHNDNTRVFRVYFSFGEKLKLADKAYLKYVAINLKMKYIDMFQKII